MQNDMGDTILNHYFLEHSFQLLTNRHYIGDLLSPAFFYPYKNVLTFADNLFGSAPIYWASRAFFSPELSYQLWMIIVCVLNFVSFAVLMRHYGVSHVLSVIGAFLFAFGMPRIAQIGHQQLLPQFFTPLAFLVAWDFIRCPKNKQLALSLLLVYLQVLSSIYLGWFLIFSLIICAAIVCVLNSDIRYRLLTYFKQNYKVVIVIAITWILLMLALLAPYLQAKAIMGERSYAEVETMLPRFSSWFLPLTNSFWWPALSWIYKDLPMAHEHHLFLGFLIIFLTGLSAYTLLFRNNILFERSLIIKVCLLTAFTIFILCLRLPNGWSIWIIIYKVVPGASVIRGVTRIWTVFYFYLLVAVVVCLDSLLHTMLVKRLRIAVLTLLCIGCLLEQIVIKLPSFEKITFTNEVAQIQELMQNNCNVAYIVPNPENPFWISHLSAMWAGIKANIPVVNGYSGNAPPNYGDISKSMNAAQLINWLGEGSKGRLCMISKHPLKEKDKLVSTYSAKESTILGNWSSYQIQLPIPKIFSQQIRLYEFPKTLEAGSVVKVPVIVKNTSNFFWSTTGKHPTNFSYRWIDSNGKLLVFDEDSVRTILPFDLDLGESAALNPVIKTPTKPGKYSLTLTMVQESVAWFSDIETQSTKIDVTIASQP